MEKTDQSGQLRDDGGASYLFSRCMVKGKWRKDERHGRKQQKKEEKTQTTLHLNFIPEQRKLNVTLLPASSLCPRQTLHRKIIRKIVPHREKRECHDRCHELIILLYKPTPESVFFFLNSRLQSLSISVISPRLTNEQLDCCSSKQIRKNSEYINSPTWSGWLPVTKLRSDSNL